MSIRSRRSSVAADGSTIRAPSPSSSTSTEAPSAAPTISGSRVSAAAPRASPEAIPGSQAARCSSDPASEMKIPATAFAMNGLGAHAYPSSS